MDAERNSRAETRRKSSVQQAQSRAEFWTKVTKIKKFKIFTIFFLDVCNCWFNDFNYFGSHSHPRDW